MTRRRAFNQPDLIASDLRAFFRPHPQDLGKARRFRSKVAPARTSRRSGQSLCPGSSGVGFGILTLSASTGAACQRLDVEDLDVTLAQGDDAAVLELAQNPIRGRTRCAGHRREVVLAKWNIDLAGRAV